MRTIFTFLITLLFAASVTASTLAQEPEREVIFTYYNADNFVLRVEKDLEGKTLIVYEGEVSYRFGRELSRMLERFPDTAYLELHSEGGLLGEIHAPSDIIFERQLPIVIPEGKYCVSACAFMALASPDITVNGQIAFHAPYFPAFGRESTLFEIQQSMVKQTTKLIQTYYKYGWRMSFYFAMADQADLKNYMVFEDSDKLAAYRISGPEEFNAPPLPLDHHVLRTGEEIAEFARQQKL